MLVLSCIVHMCKHYKSASKRSKNINNKFNACCIKHSLIHQTVISVLAVPSIPNLPYPRPVIKIEHTFTKCMETGIKKIMINCSRK